MNNHLTTADMKAIKDSVKNKKEAIFHTSSPEISSAFLTFIVHLGVDIGRTTKHGDISWYKTYKDETCYHIRSREHSFGYGSKPFFEVDPSYKDKPLRTLGGNDE